MCSVFTNMEHQIKFINGILWLDGIKYWRVASLNKTEFSIGFVLTVINIRTLAVNAGL